MVGSEEKICIDIIHNSDIIQSENVLQQYKNMKEEMTVAYFGIFDGMKINGEEVDTSRLESEGKIIVGDEEMDPDDLITEEDRLQFFNDGALQNQRSLLNDIDILFRKIDEDGKTDTKHSQAYYGRYRELVMKFRTKVEDCTFPEKLEDWWSYTYDVTSTGITLKLAHTDSFDLCADDTIMASCDTEFELLHIRAKLLTVEQYAQAYGVTTTTVRQWIRRGKIQTAIKQGSEWRIPELAEITDRGYTGGRYERLEYLTDLPEKYTFFNDYDIVDISQNKEHRELFDLCFSRRFDVMKVPEEKWSENWKEIQLDKKEREKFELYLISSPFVKASAEYITGRG